MRYDADGPMRTSSGSTSSPPFSIDFVVGGDEAAGCSRGPEALPLSLLYFCDGCSRIVSKRDLAEDIDAYFCPHCLENMSPSEATLHGIRKGTDGVSTNGVTANFMFFDREGLCGYSHEPNFIFPKFPGRTFFPNLSKSLLLQRPH